MEELIAKVEKLINVHFPDESNVLEFSETVPGKMVGGSFTTSRFRGMEMADRQKVIRAILKEHLSPKEARSIGAIFTFTPRELVIVEENALAA